MKALKVVLTHPLHTEIVRQELRPHAEVVLATTPTQLRRELASAHGLITLLSQPITPALLDQAPHLRVVGNYAVGVDNIDLGACAKRGIRVINTPGVLTRSTAELALTLLLGAARRAHEGLMLCQQRRFRGWAPDLLVGLELKGRHAVLVGRGRIGRETENLFRGVGLTTEWITRTDSAAVIAAKLSRAQVLSLHLPLSPATHHWLDSRRIALLPPDAIVINTARGAVIDETALISALKRRRIFAAGLDVFEHEPEIPAALAALPNAFLLPHLGSATVEARSAMAHLVIHGVLTVLRGKRPKNLVV